MRRLGYLKQFNEAQKHMKNGEKSYIVVNCSAQLPHKFLRVSANLFHENHEYIEVFA